MSTTPEILTEIEEGQKETRQMIREVGAAQTAQNITLIEVVTRMDARLDLHMKALVAVQERSNTLHAQTNQIQAQLVGMVPPRVVMVLAACGVILCAIVLLGSFAILGIDPEHLSRSVNNLPIPGVDQEETESTPTPTP